MTQVWAIDAPDPASKLVLLKLADNSNDDAVCWPSIALIVKQTGLGRSTVLRKLKFLEEMNWISRIPGRTQVTTKYKLTLPSVTVGLVPERDRSQSGTGATAGLVPQRDSDSPAAGLPQSQSGTPIVPQRDTNHQGTINTTIKGTVKRERETDDERIADREIAKLEICRQVFPFKSPHSAWGSEALRGLEAQLPISRKEIGLVGWYHSLEADDSVHELKTRRNHESSLMQNWGDEVTKAYRYLRKTGSSLRANPLAPKIKKDGPWREFFKWKYGPQCVLPASFGDLGTDQKKEWKREREEFEKQQHKEAA